MKKVLPFLAISVFAGSCTNVKKDSNILCEYKDWVVVDKDIENGFELVLQKNCDIHSVIVYPHQYFKYEEDDTIGRLAKSEKLDLKIKSLKEEYEYLINR